MLAHNVEPLVQAPAVVAFQIGTAFELYRGYVAPVFVLVVLENKWAFSTPISMRVHTLEASSKIVANLWAVTRCKLLAFQTKAALHIGLSKTRGGQRGVCRGTFYFLYKNARARTHMHTANDV